MHLLLTEKLAKLTQLAQSRSLFEESGHAFEINRLTEIIKNEITQLNGKLSQLQKLQAQIKNGGRPGQQTNHSTSVVDSLKACASLSALRVQSNLFLVAT